VSCRQGVGKGDGVAERGKLVLEERVTAETKRNLHCYIDLPAARVPSIGALGLCIDTQSPPLTFCYGQIFTLPQQDTQIFDR
jgi:hypothetical protein